MNLVPQETYKRAKYIHVHTQTQTVSEFEHEQSFLENERKDIFDKLQKLIISSIENEKQILTNNMCNFQFQNAKKCLDLRKKQFNVNKSLRNLYFEQLDFEAIQKYNQLSLESSSETQQIKILLFNQFNAIKSLYSDHTEALYDLRNKQSKALWNFNKTQCEAFKEFDIKQREPKFIKNFLCDQIYALKNFQCIQTDNILKLQHEHNKLLWELKYEHNKVLSSLKFNEEIKKLIDAIEESQIIYNKNIQNLELEQMKENHILQFEQFKNISEYNLQYVKNVESLQIQLLQPNKTKTYLKYMKEFVNKIITKNRINDKLTQEIFDLSIRDILDNDKHQVKLCDYLDDDEINNKYNKYAKYNLIVQIVIFLYLTREFKLKLDLILSLITKKESEYTFNNSCLKYLKIVLSNLDNLIQ
jgi:glutaredoxin-related protein